MLDPNDTCTKTGRPVLEVLQEKHPDQRSAKLEGFPYESYNNPPEMIPLSVTADHIERVAAKLSGSAGADGVDGADLCHWLLRFGAASDSLRNALAETAKWLANEKPSWAAHRAVMACRLVALDKQPGTRPVGIGSVF